jgi:N-methylhydantoinase B
MTMTVVAEPQTTELDPITFEVIRHRLLAITDEQVATLSQISGSPLVTEATDFNVGLYLADGAAVAMGRTILFHAASIARVVGYVIDDCSEDPGIAPGDMFVVNNPWKGAQHAMDVGVVAPIFHAGELVAWSGAMCHMLDVGGLRPSSFCIGATEMYQEGLQLPPMKIVEHGRPRKDVLELILAHTRVPATVNLDLKGLIAANTTAARGVERLIGRYGRATVTGVMSGLIDQSERRMRRRLRELPDGVVRSVGYIDNDGAEVDEIYEVALEMTKRGDAIRFDFNGSSPQAPSYINCTMTGLMCGLAAAVLPTIAYDIPWNAGLFRPIEVVCEEGLICNATPPAAVSGGVLEAQWMVEMTAQEALSKLAACSEAHHGEAQAVPAGGPDICMFAGVNNEGERFTQVMLDILATGGGAYADHDGVWTQGQHDIERQTIANAETNELDLPILYLWRGLAPDSGGAGRHRGGLTLGSAWTFTGEEPMEIMCGGHGWSVPNSVGLFGGHPGAENDRLLIERSDVRARLAAGRVPAPEEVVGTRRATRGRYGRFTVTRDDVYAVRPQSGGGWGDPLDRPVAALREDLDGRAVSRVAARDVYGAVLDEHGLVDEAATAERRRELRDRRAVWPIEAPAPELPDGGGLVGVASLGEALEIAGDGARHWTRCRCGHVLCGAGDAWRRHARRAVTSARRLGPAVPRLDERMEVRQYACPGCLKLLATDVTRAGADPLHDIELNLSRTRQKENRNAAQAHVA